jgi:ABC-type lipoprotein export system ATPase subunit/ABC-type antimicrobial peptide transport system permease subunit
LKKIYKSKNGGECAAVDGVSLSFSDEGFIFITGKSGSGKSTLLNLISGMDGATDGEIFIAGKSAKDFTTADYDIYRNTYVGFIFQDFSLIDSLTVGENIETAVLLQGADVEKKDVIDALEKVGLEKEYYNRRTNELSGGQKQRVAIARALIKNPKIIFADEPTGALDAETGKQIMDVFKELSKERLIIAVSHDIDNALIYGDRIIVLKDGKVVSDKTKTREFDLAALKAEYQSRVDEGFETTEEEVGETKNTFKRVSTKIPFRQALKIGLDNFKQKKFHFILTVFLTVCALTIFATANVMRNFDPHKASLMTYEKLNIKTLAVSNTKEKEDADSDLSEINSFIEETREAAAFDYPLLQKVEKDISGVMPSYRFGSAVIPSFDGERPKRNAVYNVAIESFTEINGGIENFYNAKLSLGRLPTENQNAVEIIISDYTAESIMFYGGRFLANEIVYPNTGYENILNKVFEFNNIPFKIVGIFDTDYEETLAPHIERGELNLKEDFRAKFNLANVYTTALTVKDALYNRLTGSFAVPAQLCLFKDDGDENSFYDIQNAGLVGAASIGLAFGDIIGVYGGLIVYADGVTKDTAIGKNDIVLPFSYISALVENPDFSDLTPSDLKNIKFKISLYDETYPPIFYDPDIIAVYDDYALAVATGSGERSVVMSQAKRDAVLREMLTAATVFVPIDAKEKNNERLLNYLDGNNLWYLTYASGELKTFNTLFSFLSDLLNYVSLAMLIFVTVLIYSFISSGVKRKTREIGVLRALGARGVDIAKIFAIEGGAIFVIQTVFSVLLIFVSSSVINKILTQQFVNSLVLLSVSFSTLLLTALLGIAAIIIASILPLIRLIKMKPAEVMKARE